MWEAGAVKALHNSSSSSSENCTPTVATYRMPLLASNLRATIKHTHTHAHLHGDCAVLDEHAVGPPRAVHAQQHVGVLQQLHGLQQRLLWQAGRSQQGGIVPTRFSRRVCCSSISHHTNEAVCGCGRVPVAGGLVPGVL